MIHQGPMLRAHIQTAYRRPRLLRVSGSVATPTPPTAAKMDEDVPRRVVAASSLGRVSVLCGREGGIGFAGGTD